MNAPLPLAWDSETHLIAERQQAPRLVCVSYAFNEQVGLMLRDDSYQFLKHNLDDPNVLFVCHNAAYDFAVAAANWPDLIPAIFAAYANNRITDTNVREKLARIARGTHFKAGDYRLADLVQHYLGKDRWAEKKAPDAWRLRYSELDGVPLDSWPEGARAYAIEDSTDALAVYNLQAANDNGRGFLEDEFRQARKEWWLHLAECRGLITHPERVAALDKRVRTRYEELQKILIADGLVREKRTKKRADDPDGKWKAGEVLVEFPRKEKLARQLMFDTCKWLGLAPVLTDTAKKKLRKARKSNEEFEVTPNECALSSEACEKVSHEPDHDCHIERGKCPQCLLADYGEYSGLCTYISTDLPILWKGVDGVIHARFDGLKDTGRTGCKKPNLQNQKRDGGVRECYIPRPGFLFIDCDYDGLELRTMAQVCVSVFGFSHLADALNAGDDPHLRVGAQILGISYEEAVRRRADGDQQVEDARQTGKICNFGFPGGLGAASLVDYAWSNYRMRITEDRARQLKSIWINTFPEFQRYFEWIGSHIREDGKGAFKHLFSNRTRGESFFTQLCNSPFQGLGADATGNAGFVIAYACYVDKSSPLYGSRIVNYIHDQFILETPDNENAPAAAAELERLMCEGANEFLPDVPATAPPCLCRCWSKKAKAVYDETGTLIPWDIAA